MNVMIIHTYLVGAGLFSTEGEFRILRVDPIYRNILKQMLRNLIPKDHVEIALSTIEKMIS